MRIRLLSHADVERLVRNPRAFGQEEPLLFCTVMELIQIADAAVKRRSNLDWSGFLNGWQTITEQKRLYVAPLDIDCLNRAIFERSDSHIVTGLWPAVCEQTLPPDRAVRRLILRPSEQSWWGDELYTEMEAWYGEEDVNG
ncbi:MAG: hypothetical protein Kow0063_41770 [Anaerolineae bacterium]